MKHPFRFLVVMFLIVSLVVGCATTGENTSGRALGTAIGAITGAFIGGNKHGAGGALAGALIGGAAGYAVGWLVDDYRAKKTKTAQQVREQYGMETQGDAAPTKLVDYQLAVIPSSTVPRGESTEIMTTFDITGRDGDPLKVAEELTILKPDGTELSKVRSEYKEVDGPGGYEFIHPVPVPQGVDQGYYSVSSAIYINGNPAGEMTSSFQVVSRGSARMIAKR